MLKSHMIKSAQIPVWGGGGLMKPHPELRNYWQLTAAGGVGQFLHACDPRAAIHAPVEDPTPMSIEGTLRRLGVFTNKACTVGHAKW